LLHESENNLIVKEVKKLTEREEWEIKRENLVVGPNMEVFFDMTGLSLQI